MCDESTNNANVYLSSTSPPPTNPMYGAVSNIGNSCSISPQGGCSLNILLLPGYGGCKNLGSNPDSKVHGANMGPIWGRQDPGGPHVGPMNLDIWEVII